ncbi:ABC transporter permease subunit [Aurantimonas sp. Leaf443]|uniref:ABC transporter permease subunit n=1 Tax=Aurantimonas sp. Leaf443 TaxID=1736378 RepID=UPI0006F24421|nr:ABC transporter permease subunit [Aurantimonas sp. Leaf443]KQT85159.1 thiamine ABC transporter permease [Aurantimonas sp. Leaf443]
MTRAGDLALRRALGLCAAALLGLLLAGPFVVLLLAQPSSEGLSALAADPYLRAVALFTLEQAGLSALLSVAGAVPLALALHRTKLAGRGFMLRLFLMPQALPVLVGALALVSIWGRGGLVSDALAALGLPRLDLYGLPGILLAHVFFNMPLATRLMVSALDAVPAESWKLAAQLGLGPGAVLRTLEWPAIRRALPGAASLAFLLCVTSFTLVLVLGGGPGATTLQVAIYQALRYDFDPNRAIALSLLQIAATALVLALTARLGGEVAGGFSLGARAGRFERRSLALRIGDGIVLTLGLAFVASPFVAVVALGLSSDLARLLSDPLFHRAAATSLLLALGAASLSLALSLAILLGVEARRRPGTRARPGASLPELATGLVLVVPPIVVGAGWFLALRQVTDVARAAPFLVMAVNAAMAVPFVVRIAGPALAEGNERHRRLADGLGLAGLARLRLVDWPALRRPLALAFAFALAVSLGDLGAVALFGNQDFVTLPTLLFQRMGSYRTDDAQGLALLLGLLCLALVALAERGLSGKAPR